MGGNFYTTEQCSTIPVTGLQDAFERCTTNSPNLGVIIDTPDTDFNDFNNCFADLSVLVKPNT